MEDHKTVSVSRVYVPNEFTVYLAAQDRESFASYEPRWSPSWPPTSRPTRAAAGLSLVAPAAWSR